MNFQLATSLLAGCVVQTAAEAPAAIVNNAAVFSTKTQDLLSTPTNGIINKKQHRLLQKMKKRKYRAHNSQIQSRHGDQTDNADVGILSSKSDIPRFLQEENYDYYCPRDTCPDELCNCADQGGSLEDCTTELQDVCRAGHLDLCVFSEYVQVYQEVYCPFVSCVSDGFRENQCDCAFYDLYCSRLQGEECTPLIQSSAEDQKPFFGCDEEELANVCDEAKSCRDKGDLQGLPLGTWQGSVQTGIMPGNSGERVGGASVVTGVTAVSMLWLMVNA